MCSYAKVGGGNKGKIVDHAHCLIASTCSKYWCFTLFNRQNDVSIVYQYKFSVCHKLKPGDGAKRIKFCRWILDFTSNENVFNKFYFSVEVWFHSSGYINMQNFRARSATNLHQLMESPLHPQTIGVFCAMSREKTVGPCFFTITINRDRYEDLMFDFISQLCRNERSAFSSKMEHAFTQKVPLSTSLDILLENV